VETSNHLPMTLIIDSKGKTTVEIKDLPVAPADAAPATESKTAMKPYVFPSDLFIQRKITEPSKFPKIHAGQLGLGTNLESYVSFYAALIAFDALNDRGFYTNTQLSYSKKNDYSQGGLYGFADVNYFNLASGYSLGLDYWHRSTNFQKADVHFSWNIFLHEFLNWDVTLRRNHVRAVRYRGEWPRVTAWIREWQRTYLGTTFSLDTTTADWHGPISGNAVFASIEVGADDSAYQSLDLNLDARHYWPFTDRTGLAFRFAGGTSFGPSPTSFVWGGNKTFRGIPLFSQSGNSYVLQSTELRVPLFDFIRAKASNPIVDALLLPFTTTIDARGGIYNDLGDIWNRSDFEGLFKSDHSGFNLQSSTGVFLNIPSLFGFTLRFSWAVAGKKHSSFWIGRNF
jgi:outer membrane protein assembly factor BamA